MKKLSVLFAVVVLSIVVATFAFAGDQIATVKAVDLDSNSLVLKIGDAEHTLKADTGTDLSKVKLGDKVDIKLDQGLHLGQYNTGDKVEFEFIKGMLKSIKFGKVKTIKQSTEKLN